MLYFLPERRGHRLQASFSSDKRMKFPRELHSRTMRLDQVSCDGSCTLRIMKCPPYVRNTGGNLGGTAIVDSRPFVMRITKGRFLIHSKYGKYINADASKSVPKEQRKEGNHERAVRKD